MTKPLLPQLERAFLLLLWAVLALQIFFTLRIALMRVMAPESSSFERSGLYQTWQNPQVHWQEQWVAYTAISKNLKRAVIASEDADFIDHDGVDWAAVEGAWDKNARAEKAAKASEAARKRAAKTKGKAQTPSTAAAKTPPPKLVGGSTITQQLAKNLFLSGERNMLRKAQEFVLTLTLELLLDKQRIYEIYLNHVEWGTGIYGAQAAAQHYFHKNASELQAFEAARLAVMLPRPKYFEKRFEFSDYLSSRASVIEARMNGIVIP